jgi:general secretion pathway protein A
LTNPLYLDYFGLKEIPFSIAPDPHYLYMSERHREALAHMKFGVESGGGFVLLTGEVGTGKTTIARCVIEQLDEKTNVALILNPRLDPVELLSSVCDELQIHHNGTPSLKDLTDSLNKYLITSHEMGRKTILMIDEAQHLSFDVLEQIRLLTNLETNTRKLLQIILIGQPELQELVNRQELRQLAQRITARYHLLPLDLEQTKAYIRHRLKVAGLPAHSQLFSDNSLKLLHKFSQGIPRLINVLCDRSLLGVYSEQSNKISAKTIRQAANEAAGVQQDVLARYARPHWQWTFVVSALATAMLWFFLLSSTKWLQKDDQREKLSNAALSTTLINYDRSGEKALDDLAQSWNLTYQQLEAACYRPQDNQWAFDCEQIEARDWQKIKEINRPMMIRFVDEQLEPFYLSIVKIEKEHVIAAKSGQYIRIEKAILAPYWGGEATYIWRRPRYLSLPIAQAFEHPIVEWIKTQLAQTGDFEGDVDSTFDIDLVDAIKQFQKQHRLKPDGLIGKQTLMQLLTNGQHSPTLE